LLLFHGTAGAAGELPLGHFLFFFALDIAREILNCGLRGPTLIAGRGDQRFFFGFLFVLFFVFREWQNGLRPFAWATGAWAPAAWAPAASYLQEEEIPDGLIFDAIHHVLEQREGFLLILDQRIFLAVAAQPDTFLEVIHRQQVIFPLVVDDIEHHHALGFAHVVRADQLFLFGVAASQQIVDVILNLLARHSGQFLRVHFNAELGQHVGLQPREVKSAGMGALRAT